MIKKITCFVLTALLCLSISTVVFAYYYGESLPRLIDDAELLNEDDKSRILNKLDGIAETYEFDVIAATVNSLEGKGVQEYADDLYDYNDFGLGDKKDGILLLISMEDRDVYISTTGYGIDVFPDSVWNHILDVIVPYMSSGDYSSAIETYASLCEDYIENAEKGNFDGYDYNYSYDYNYDYDYDYDYNYGDDYQPKRGLDIKWIPISIIIGMAISFGIMWGFRSQLKSVHRKPAARDYQIPGSMQVTEQSDMFLYNHVTRTPKQTQNNNHRGGGGFSGGGVHVGSSGRSHGGGGRKF